MTYPTHLIPTTVVGSYPQPEWLVDRSALEHHGVPRVSARDIWRIPEAWLEQAQDDATILAIRDMERAGIDIVSDGEIRRESYSNYFGLALDGLDTVNVGSAPMVAPLRYRVSPAASAARIRSSCATPSFSSRMRRMPPRSRCPAPSPWRSRRRTSSTPTRRNSRWTSPRQ
jgi:5-methyltetrahydropteroyltriglutamate--homocysteine methyltransferase